MSEKVLPKLRTINQIYKDIHTEDSCSPVSKNLIKKIIVQNNIPFIQIGVKKMYDEKIVFEHIEKSFITRERS